MPAEGALLATAPQAWNKKLHNTLQALGFKQSPHDPTMYWRTHGDLLLLLGVYVNDLIITRSIKVEIDGNEGGSG